MNDIVIEAEGVSKIYRLGARDSVPPNLANRFFGFLKNPVQNYRFYRSLYDFSDVFEDKTGAAQHDIIWALRDVSFQIKRGEIVGIIGMNGAGKSTLLKILSRITPPTRGRIQMIGRVGSLLEVGTGFHQELTGRENIYLNGTILGMRKVEVDRKFDEIVAFSGVAEFLDTPVKRYSSGMRVRLAFAVAAHLEPEILIVDEVLAVGDQAFQKKCINKMQDVSEQGRTVLFVSHSMPAIARLCQRAVLLNHGQILLDGGVHQVVGAYLSGDGGTAAEKLWGDVSQAPGDELARLRAVRVKNRRGEVSEAMDITQSIWVEMEYDVLQDRHVLFPLFVFHNEEGVHLFSSFENDINWRDRVRPIGSYKSSVEIPGNLLSEGVVYVTPALMAGTKRKASFNLRDVVAFHVVDNLEAESARAGWHRNIGGAVRPLLKWQTVSAEPARRIASG